MSVTTISSAPVRFHPGSQGFGTMPIADIERNEGNAFFYSERLTLGSSEGRDFILDPPDASYCADFVARIVSTAAVTVDFTQVASSEIGDAVTNSIFNKNLNSSTASGMSIYYGLEGDESSSTESSSTESSSSNSDSNTSESSSTEPSSSTGSESSSTESSSTENQGESSSSEQDDGTGTTMIQGQSGTFEYTSPMLVLDAGQPLKIALSSSSASNSVSVLFEWYESSSSDYAG